MISELIDKYIWLIQVFIDAAETGLSLDEICRKWEDRYNEPYSRRTFNNHRLAIQDSFGIEIECDRSRNRYLIRYGKEALDSESSISWLINTFTVNNLLSLGRERLSGRVSVEDIPSGHVHLTGIISAMLSNRQLEISYRKYDSNEDELLHIDPYAVKESERRWYLVGWCHERNAMRHYGLDRITSIYETHMSFRLPDGFDVEDLYRDSFGIYAALPDDVCTIRFRADEKQARYLRDLPMHKSQRELGHRDGFVEFSIRTAPNDALYMELMRYGDKIEVTSPEDVRQRLGEEFRKAAARYES